MKAFDFVRKLFGAKPVREDEAKVIINTARQIIAEINAPVEETKKKKYAFAFSTEVDLLNIDKIRDCFIAFDVETTGLSKVNDRIVEIGAVIFRNGKPEDYFHSLMNTGVPISSSAFAVNHITDTMIAEAPTEKEVYSKLVDFLGEAMSGKIIMCAHNADFDFAFLTRALDRLGYGDARIEYVDTLQTARKYLKGLENYQQTTVAEYLGIENGEAHRAVSDAECCGHILCRLLDVIENPESDSDEVSFVDDLAWKTGYNYWQEGEKARKAGQLDEAIKLFDKARQNGYLAPAIFDSYAMAYRKLKKYENEISILDEAVERIPDKAGRWIERKSRAFELLNKQKGK